MNKNQEQYNDESLEDEISCRPCTQLSHNLIQVLPLK